MAGVVVVYWIGLAYFENWENSSLLNLSVQRSNGTRKEKKRRWITLNGGV